ncbi:MAG: glycosyltransferase family 4 protein [Verrucomicrobiales bacterium]
MKIALIYEKFISRGGLENYLYSFANQLVENGHHLSVITGATDTETEGLRNTELHRLPRNSLTEFSHGAENLLAQLQFDVSIGFGRTVAHDLHRAGGGCHRYYSDHILHPLKRSSRKNRSELLLEKELYTSGKTRHFVVNSQMVADQLEEAYSLSPDRISVIRTAVDAQRFRPASSQDELGALRTVANDGAPIFLFVSMNHRRKGLDALLRAWLMVSADAQLWVVGPELSGRHLRFIKKTGISDRVRSFVMPDDIVPFYQAADFFIHPTLYDASANTVLQSMACGLPGIISAHDGGRQFVEEGRTGLLLPHPSDPDEIAQKVTKMLETPEPRRQKMGDLSRKKMLEQTWDKHVSDWESLLETVAEDRRA